MKAFLILEDGTVFTGTSIGSTRDMISEIVFNTSMTGYLEVLTDPSYAGQAVVMTYPLIGNYGITPDMESRKAWPDGYIVRELSRIPSNFRCEDTIQNFLAENDIPGICGIDTRALTKLLREKGTMNGMITTKEYSDLSEPISRMKAYTVAGVVMATTTKEKYVLPGNGKKVALMDFGAKKNIARSLNERGCEVTVYPADTPAEEVLAANPDGIMLSNAPDKENIAIGIIPNGIGNDFADYWEMSSDYKKAVDCIINNRRRKIDVGTCYYYDGEKHLTRYFLNAINIGLGARIVKITDQCKRFWGVKFLSYFMALLSIIFERKLYRMHLKINGEHIRGRIMTV